MRSFRVNLMAQWCYWRSEKSLFFLAPQRLGTVFLLDYKVGAVAPSIVFIQQHGNMKIKEGIGGFFLVILFLLFLTKEWNLP